MKIMKDTRESMSMNSDNTDNASVLASVLNAGGMRIGATEGGGGGGGGGEDGSVLEASYGLSQVLAEALGGGGGKSRSRSNSAASK